MALTNWAGTDTFRAHTLHRPSSRDELRSLVARAPAIRVLGTRHSWGAIADSAQLVSLERLPREVAIDESAGAVSLSANLTYAQLAAALDARGLALHNLASLPHISVAGAIATATHGSGDRNATLAASVRALELVTSTGETVTIARGDRRFSGAVVGLGALGAVTRITLDVEPAYLVRQRVHVGLPWDAYLERIDEIMAAGDSVSAFTRWGPQVDQLWIKAREGVTPALPDAVARDARPAAADVHPLAGGDPRSATTQRGIPGRWSDRLPHFRAAFAPSSGDEIQSEYLVARHHATAALTVVHALASRIAPLLHVSEIRTVAADDLWMSPAYGRGSLAIHFTWLPSRRDVEAALVDVEAALAPFGARPHWGKLFLAGAAAVAPLYPRHDDFAALVAELDARGAFANDWLRDHVLARRASTPPTAVA